MAGSPIAAQTALDDAASKARVHFGPLAINPTIALSSLGVDTNVFYAPEDPKRDFTMTWTPQAAVWLRMGRTWVTGTVREDLVYYKTYSTERAANLYERVGWVVPFNRVTLSVGSGYLSTRERPGFEIDARSQRSETSFDASADVRLFPKTSFAIRGERLTVDFDKAAVFLDSNLHFELNRTMTTGTATLKYQLTPLTAVSLIGSRERDTFEFSPLRDSTSTRVSAAVGFDPFALIKGNASLGYRDFEPEVAGLPNFRGLISDLDLSYTAFGRMRLGLRALRDVQYSFEIEEPYYVLSGATTSLTQQLFGPIDGVGRIGVQRLDYRNRFGAHVALTDRVDYVHTYGVGVGYRVGKDMRLGLNVDHQKRTSSLQGRQYAGLLIGTSVTYGY
jgi:hypothetical protein